MAETTAIQWCDATFNPWIGCTRVSPGCQHCYAESFARRYGKAEWGPTADRVRTSAAYWRKPLAWNAKAEREGRRPKVFCASLADVFEDNPQVAPWREELFHLIAATPYLDWLLLTKRPENVEPALRAILLPGARLNALDLVDNNYFNNIWWGTSVENQEQADKRIPALAAIPAWTKFLSCEPLLGPLDLTPWLGSPEWKLNERGLRYRQGPLVEWVIVGGESGPQARPMHEDWARSLRDQCQAAEVPFFFKQWGQWLPASQRPDNWYNSGDLMLAADKQTPGRFIRLASKHDAGRLLDGREWNQMPEGAA